MSNSVLSSFDPLATHPFTNNSGLLPKPTPPSQFPHPVPSSSKAFPTHPHPAPHAHAHAHPHHASAPGPIILTITPVQAPQPKRASPAHSNSNNSTGRKPIFVPFRPERSSPDLEDILLKKKFADAFQGKASWGIDQIVPRAPAVPAAGRQGKAQ